MDEEKLRFLRGRAAVARHDELARGASTSSSTVTAEEGQAGDALRLGGLQGQQNVGGIAAGGEHDKEIPRFREPVDLPRKNLVVPKIVANARQQRPVRGKGDRREGSSGFGITPHQFGGKVSRFRGTATVSANQQFTAAAQRGDNQIPGFVDGRAQGRQRLKRGDRGRERAFESHRPEQNVPASRRDQKVDLPAARLAEGEEGRIEAPAGEFLGFPTAVLFTALS